MSKQVQFQKNIDLSERFADYVVNTGTVSDLKSGVSYVPFSASNSSLNKANNKLVNDLVKTGQKVIKAIETKDSKNPWVLSPVSC